MMKVEALARKVDAFVFNRGELLGVTRAAVTLGLEPSTVATVLNGPRVKAGKAENPWIVSMRKYASPKRFKVYEAIRTNPNASLTEISEMTGVKLRYVQKVARDLKQNGGTGSWPTHSPVS